MDGRGGDYDQVEDEPARGRERRGSLPRVALDRVTQRRVVVERLSAHRRLLNLVHLAPSRWVFWPTPLSVEILHPPRR